MGDFRPQQDHEFPHKGGQGGSAFGRDQQAVPDGVRGANGDIGCFGQYDFRFNTRAFFRPSMAHAAWPGATQHV